MTDPRTPRRLARPLAAALAATVALGAAPLSGLAAAAPITPPVAVSIDSFCAAVPSSFDLFEDSETNTFATEIDCLAVAEITNGVTATSYAPAANVSRGQMASFIARLMDTAEEQDVDDEVRALPAYDGQNRFVDSGDDTHVENINRLAAAGVTLGGPGGLPANQFGPGQAVSRAQMASFIARAVEYVGGENLPVWGEFFSDAGSTVHTPRINQVARLGIAQGNNGRFLPNDAISRGQMAAFLARTLAWAMNEGRIAPLFAHVSAEGSEVTTVDNMVGTASHTFTVVDNEERPVRGLRAKDFSFRIEGGTSNVNGLVRSAPDTWSFSEVEDGVYRLVESSPVNLNRTYTDLRVRNVVIQDSLTITLTQRGITNPGT